MDARNGFVLRIKRVLLSCAVAFALCATVLFFPALATEVSGLTVNGLKLSYDNLEPYCAINASGTMVTLSAKASGTIFSTTQHTAKATFTNTLDVEAVLVFTYGVSKAGESTPSSENDGEVYSMSLALPSGGTYEVSITSKNKTDTSTMTISDIQLVVDANATTTFTPAENGSYTVNGTLISGETQMTQSSSAAYTLAATANSGFIFYGWIDEETGEYLSTSNPASLNIDKNRKITAVFMADTLATFTTGGSAFTNLNAAVEYAEGSGQSKITLTNSGELPAGSYTIPSGITLLIPYDSSYTVSGNDPEAVYGKKSWSTEDKEWEQPSRYKTLTILDGASITVNGALEVGGKHFANSWRYTSIPTEACGFVEMKDGSSITVNSGGNLYAWGFIIGNGKITAKSGAVVYEYFQLSDWRGGSVGSDMVDIKDTPVFLFSQYYVQNIEVTLTLESGAIEKARFSSAVSSNIILVSTEITVIGSTAVDGMFVLKDGTLTKKYDPSTDRVGYTIDGIASLGTVAIKLKASIGPSIDMSSASYALPMNSNISLIITSGSTFEASSDVIFLPGTVINVEYNGNLAVKEGVKVFVYDRDEWINKGYVYVAKEDGSGYYDLGAVRYTPTRTYNRTQNDLANAVINVNGTFTVNGQLYTTASGANICSSKGTGKIVLNTAPSADGVAHYQMANNSTSNYQQISITAAQLKNTDNSYTATAGASAGDVYTYCTDHCGGKWVCGVAKVGGSAVKYFTLQDAAAAANGNTVTMLHDTTEGTVSADGFALDLSGCTVNADLSGAFSGFDTSGGYSEVNGTMVFTEPKGKIVGAANSVAKTYQTPTTNGTFQRYVAVQNDNETSFHQFNISVTGFRALFDPVDGAGALFFEAQFRGDAAVQGAVKEIGFTVGNTTETMSNPIGSSELYISAAVWDKQLTAESVAESCSAAAYIKFDGETVASTAQSIDYITALKSAYASGNGSGMLSLKETRADGKTAYAIVDEYLASHGEIKAVWDAATALTLHSYVN